MGESEEVIDLKKEELKKELARPNWSQNKDKVKRLKEAIDRHKDWEKNRKQAKLRRIKLKEGGRNIIFLNQKHDK